MKVLRDSPIHDLGLGNPILPELTNMVELPGWQIRIFGLKLLDPVWTFFLGQQTLTQQISRDYIIVQIIEKIWQNYINADTFTKINAYPETYSKTVIVWKVLTVCALLCLMHSLSKIKTKT